MWNVKMHCKFSMGSAAVVLLLSPLNAFGRDRGDPEKGRIVAQEMCSSCHTTASAAAPSPNPKAPAFASLSQMPGMTAIALRAALQTSHKTMPNLVLRKHDRENVIAYILGLKQAHLP